MNEPASGYLWGNLAAHGKTLLPLRRVHLDHLLQRSRAWRIRSRGRCCRAATARDKAIAPGEALPAEWGGGVNKWPWPIPLIAANVATKPELVGHFAEEAPDFDLRCPTRCGWRFSCGT